MTTEIFARKASGLVREAGLFEMWTWNLWATVPITFPIFVLPFLLMVLPGANIPVALLFAIIANSLIGSIYAHFTAAMPRSGGEYVFLSRTIHPLIGLLMNWGMGSAFMVWYGYDFLFVAWMFNGFIGLFNPSVSAVLSQPVWTFIVGFIISLIALLIAIRGFRLVLKVMVGIATIGFIAIAATVAAFLATGGIAGFMTMVNKWSAPYMPGIANPFQEIINRAVQTGFTLPSTVPINASHTLGLITVMSGTSIICVGFNSYIAGEMKKADSVKRQHIAMVGGNIAYLILGVILLSSVLFATGKDFAGASYYLSVNAPEQYPLPASLLYFPFSYLDVVAPRSAPIFVLFGLFLISFLLQLMSPTALSRMFFAWAMDRHIPVGVTRVSEKYKTPYVAMILAFIGGMIMSIIFLLVPTIWAYIAFTFLFTITNMLVLAIAGIIFPYLRKDMYKAMPTKIEVGGVPLMSIISALGLIAMISLLTTFAIYPETFTYFGAASWDVVAVYIGVYLAPVIVHFLSRMYWKRQGIDIMMAFKEVPPA
ncbi:MAG: APC family permease [Candidatus Bathyarchaeia archaeon]